MFRFAWAPALAMLLAFAPLAFASTISAPLTFSVTAESTAQPGIYRGDLHAILTVAPDLNSPISGIAAEVNYLYSFNVPDPSCGAYCSWFFGLVGYPSWGSGGFELYGDPSPQNVQGYGGQTRTVLLPAGEYLISLSALRRTRMARPRLVRCHQLR